MPECEHCGHRTEAKVNFCVKCGTPSTPQSEPNTEPALPEPDPEDTHQTDTPTSECLNCGHENPQENNFCINCGKDINISEPIPDYEATPNNDSLEETLSELRHIEFSLSQVTNPDELLSRQFIS